MELRYTQPMTQTLNAAIAKLSDLPPDEQDRVGKWLLDELQDEEAWSRQFASSSNALNKLAQEARNERTKGVARKLDPEML